jgi:hypothetical protein
MKKSDSSSQGPSKANKKKRVAETLLRAKIEVRELVQSPICFPPVYYFHPDFLLQPPSWRNWGSGMQAKSEHPSAVVGVCCRLCLAAVCEISTTSASADRGPRDKHAINKP